jgi:hypothetical protein
MPMRFNTARLWDAWRISLRLMVVAYSGYTSYDHAVRSVIPCRRQFPLVSFQLLRLTGLSHSTMTSVTNASATALLKM